MLGLRHKRTTRDRSHGLVFQWRLPVGNSMSFCTAILVVVLITAGLAASVRVRVGGSSAAPRHAERRGTMIVVPSGPEWDSLRTMAEEAGPFPVRMDPTRDPAVAALIQQGLAAATPPGYRYQPQYQAVELTIPDPGAETAEQLAPGVLPPLPELEAPAAAPVEPAAQAPGLVPLVLAVKGPRAQAPEGAPPAGALQGNRYLLLYDAEGRVTRVIPIFTAAADQANPADPAATEVWLRRTLIEGGEKSGGSVAVEITTSASASGR